MRVPVLPLGFLFLAAAAAVAPRSSQAQIGDTGTGGTGGTTATSLVAEDFSIEIWVPEKASNPTGAFVPLKQIDQDFYFGRARCQCNTPIQIRVDMVSASRSKVTGRMNGTVNVGTGELCDCKDAGACQGSSCKSLGGSKSLSVLANGYVTFETTVGELFAANTKDAADACERRIDARSLYVRPDGDNDGYPDVVKKQALVLDGQNPPAPQGLSASSGNEALNVSWTALPQAEVDDLLGYELYCARGGTLAPFDDFAEKRRHETAETLCTKGGTTTTTGSSLMLTQSALLGPRDPESTAAPEPLRRRDAAFLCADFLTSARSARVTGLENHVPYVVGIAAVDLRYNASPIERAVVAWPYPTRDFYRSYRADGGSAEGGFCSLGGDGASRGATGWWPLALAAVGLALLRRRSRS